MRLGRSIILLAALAAAGFSISSPPPFAHAATTYFVNKSGCSDSFAGTSAQPWCTIGHASQVLTPGDTVMVGSGIYNESIIPANGNANAYVTYQGAQGATLDGTGISSQAFNMGNTSYVKIAGFEIRNYKVPRPAGNAVNIYNSSHHIELDNLLVHDNWNGIIMQNNANQITINDSEVYNQRYAVGFENNVHDVFINRVKAHNASENYIGTVVNPGYVNGDGFSADTGTSNIFIKDASAYNNADGGFDLTTINFDCDRCISYNNRYGFRLQKNGGPYTMENSLAYGNSWYPLQIQASGGATTKLYNSTFVNAPGDRGYSGEGSASNVTLRNNIFADFANSVFSSGASAIDDDYNLYSSSATPGFTLGAHSKQTDPLFINKGSGDFHLQSASPAIDAGTALANIATDLEGTTRPQGAAYDIGAYEFKSGSPPPPPPPPSSCTNPSPMPTGFAAPCPVLSVNPSIVSQTSGTLTVTLTPPSGSATYLSNTIYIYDAGQWKPFTASASGQYPGWATSQTSLALSGTQLGTLSLGLHYLVSWDWTWNGSCYVGPGTTACNTGFWRVQTFTLQ